MSIKRGATVCQREFKIAEKLFTLDFMSRVDELPQIQRPQFIAPGVCLDERLSVVSPVLFENTARHRTKFRPLDSTGDCGQAC